MGGLSGFCAGGRHVGATPVGQLQALATWFVVLNGVVDTRQVSVPARSDPAGENAPASAHGLPALGSGAGSSWGSALGAGSACRGSEVMSQTVAAPEGWFCRAKAVGRTTFGSKSGASGVKELKLTESVFGLRLFLCRSIGPGPMPTAPAAAFHRVVVNSSRALIRTSAADELPSSGHCSEVFIPCAEGHQRRSEVAMTDRHSACIEKFR